MRWGFMLALLGSGCGQPVDDSHPPPLVLRHRHQSPSEDEASPDGGNGGLQPVPAPDDPGRPVD
jgi:hypothetical protein